MSIVNGYLTLEELQDSLNSDGRVVTSIADFELAIESASRWIDERCSDPKNGRIRHFWREDTPTEHLYRADTVHMVCTSDFDDTSGMTVEVDTLGNGTWTALGSTDWQPEPLVRLNGHPYSQITVASYGTLFPLGLGPRVKVTARWGWASVPAPVKQACQILAVAYLGGKEVISMHDGFDIDATGATNPVAFAEHLLRKYLPDDIPDPALPAHYSPLR